MIAARYADGDVGSVLPLAEELTRLPVDLIATQGTATRLLLKVSTTVPVVYVFSADPVLAGIADSLARPGRDMTGITVMSIELNGKRLELLREIMPQLRRVAIIASPTHAGEELERTNSVEMAQRNPNGQILEQFQGTDADTISAGTRLSAIRPKVLGHAVPLV